MNKNFLLGFGAAFLTLSLISTKAQAGILLEPYLGFSQSDVKMTVLTVDSSAKNTGVVLGARIAYTLPAFFWLGVDYSMMTGKSKADNTPEADLSRSNLYAVAGVDFPILFRMWAGYGLINESVVKQNNNESKMTGGSAMKLGAGFNMIPFTSINLEYFKHTDAKASFNGVNADISSYDDSGITLSISLPFDL